MKKDKGRFCVKRLIGMMMAVCMLLALIPAVVFADGEPKIEIAGANEVSEGVYATNGVFAYDHGTVKVALIDDSHAERLYTGTDNVIGLSNVETVKIILIPENGYEAALNLGGGQGSATLTPEEDGTYTYSKAVSEINGVFSLYPEFRANESGGGGTGGTLPDLVNPKEVSVTTNNPSVIAEVRVDGRRVENRKVQVESADTTHRIEIMCEFGYNFSSIKINGVSMNVTAGTDRAEYEVNDADIYNIEVEVVDSGIRTLAWDYSSDNPLGEDALVQHGKVEILSTGDGIINMTEDPSKGGLVAIQKGKQVTVKLTPDYGYQLLTTALNGGQLNVTAAEDVSTFTFTMPDTNLHLSALFTQVDDKVTTSSTKVNGGTLTNGEGVIDSGNLELSVADMEPTEKQKAEIEAEAGEEGQVHLYLEMEMNQVVNKGSVSEAWNTKMTELNKKVTVTLKVTDADLKEKAAQGQVYVIREHEGSLEKIPAVYDAENETISFETDQFSTYALASGNATNYLFIGGQQVTYQKGMVSYWRYDEATSSTTACLEGDANIILDDTTDDSDKGYDLLEITLKNVDIQSKDDPSVTGYYSEGCGLWYRNVLYLNVYGDCTISGSAVGLRADGTTRIYGRNENAKLTIIGDNELSDQGCPSNFQDAYAVQGYDRVHAYNEVDGTTFSLITKSRTNNTMVKSNGDVLGCTLNGDETKIITSLNFDGSNPEEHPWDGSSYNIGNKKDYQYIEYQMKNAPVIPDEVIDTINITDVTLSFKAGESPKFTGKVVDSDKDKYSIYWEGWCLHDADDQILEEAWSDEAEDYNTLKTFVGGKKYYYNIIVSAKDGYKFSDQVKLFINEEEINWKENDNCWSNIWYLSAEHIFELIPTSSGNPAEPTEPQNPANQDQPSNPSQGGDTDKQASADVDKTPDKAKAGTNVAAKTGDESNLLLLLLMLAASGAGIAGVSVYNRRKSR